MNAKALTSSNGNAAVSDVANGIGELSEERLFDVSDLDRHSGDDVSSSCCRVRVTLDFSPTQSVLNVTIHEVRGLVEGGATRFHLALLPNKNVRQRSKTRRSADRVGDETFQFSLTSDELQRDVARLRLRLYSCDRFRHRKLLGETIVDVRSADVAAGPSTAWLTMCPRLDLNCPDASSDVSSDVSQSPSRSIGTPDDVPGSGHQPEILLGLGYTSATGRLTVSVVRGNCFRLPGSKRSNADTYVKAVMTSQDGRELASGSTSVRRRQQNPVFDESFVFRSAQSQLGAVSLFITVYVKPGSLGGRGTDRMIGWLSLGYSSSGDGERNHWNEMKAAATDGRGDCIERWHQLVEP